jgi:hypothetical protein
VFAVGDALGDALVRPGRIVMHLVFGQHTFVSLLSSDGRPLRTSPTSSGTRAL